MTCSTPPEAAPATPPGASSRRVPPPRRTPAAVVEAVRSLAADMGSRSERATAPELAERLRASGVAVTEAMLRRGELRTLVMPVWHRRAPSRRRHGPTGGREDLPVEQLVEMVVDLSWRVGRVKADLAGEIYDRAAGFERDPRSLAAVGANAARKAAMARLIAKVIPSMAARGVAPDAESVSAELSRRGKPLSARSIERCPEYMQPIRQFLGVPVVVLPPDPQRASLLRTRAVELAAMSVALEAELKELEARFAARLAELGS